MGERGTDSHSACDNGALADNEWHGFGRRTTHCMTSHCGTNARAQGNPEDGLAPFPQERKFEKRGLKLNDKIVSALVLDGPRYQVD